MSKDFKLVVAYDFSELAELALAEGLALADMQPRAHLHVIVVLDAKQGLSNLGIDSANVDGADAVLEKLEEHVSEVVKKVQPKDFYFYLHTRIGPAYREIVGLAGELEADLIVVGTHGRKGVKRMVLGSVAEQVSRHAECPVLVMRQKSYDPEERPTIEPEPPDPPGQEKHFHATIDRRRFAFTRQHQVMPMRPDDWPLW